MFMESMNLRYRILLVFFKFGRNKLRGTMSKNIVIQSMIATIILVCSVIIEPFSIVAATVSSNNIQITNIMSSSSSVENNQEVDLTVTFKGNGNVKSGDTITINLPQSTDTEGACMVKLHHFL